MKGEMTASSDIITSMPVPQGDAELKGDNKEQVIRSVHPSEGDWDMLREYEQHRLKSIKILTNDEMLDIDRWLLELHHVYEELRYPVSLRVGQTMTYLQSDERVWYEQEKSEFEDDWIYFCKKLKQRICNRSTTSVNLPSKEKPLPSMNGRTLEKIIDEQFIKYVGKGDCEEWLLRTMNHFKRMELPRSDQLRALPFLLEDVAYVWYVKNEQSMRSFESFSTLFLRHFSNVTASSNDIESSFAANLSITMTREIIKSPSYFRGSKDDVVDWLEKLEQRFKMANWNDNNKLRYISIHLQDDASRWWNQASFNITTWSSFVEAIKQAFGSTKMKELAFEQLKWYKQTTNQSITQYYDKILELCKRVDVSMTDSMKLQYLLAGVKDSLKLHIALQDPQTTESFLAYARKVEDTLSLVGSNYDASPVDIQQRENVNRPLIQYPSDQRYRQGQTEQKAHRPNQENNTTSSRRFTPTCYTCGTPGHYSRDCTRHHFD